MEATPMKRTFNEDSAPMKTGRSARVLSPDRAFVVHFHPANDPAEPPCAGRAEHVPSGRTTHFECWQELIEFVARSLAIAPEIESSEKGVMP
jgi:hypothetical protein